MEIKILCFNAFQQNCVLAYDRGGECLIVDPGFYTPAERDRLTDFMEKNALKPVKVLLTHGHFDHIYGASECAALYGIPVLMSPKDKVIVENSVWFCSQFGLRVPDGSFAAVGQDGTGGFCEEAVLQEIGDGDVIEWGEGHKWEVLATPGHTPGGVCFLDRTAKLLISGDTLFAGSIGRTDNEWGDYDLLMKGIFEKLMTLDGDVQVIPGHGPDTSIADEGMKNPFLQPFNEPYEE